jgi:hypothetical protein
MGINEKEIIKKYILGDGLSMKEKKERFEIAYDIYKNFDYIQENVVKKVMESVVKKLKEEFESNESLSDYKISGASEFFSGKKGRDLSIYKKKWSREGETLITYYIGADGSNFDRLYFGFWSPKKIDYESLALNKWKKRFNNFLENKEFKKEKILLCWKRFDDKYFKFPKDFYFDFIDNGADAVASYYVKELLSLIETTEELLDDFVKEYIDYKKK